MKMVAEEKNPAWRHQITLVDREELTVNGVVNLGSYDEKEIVMETEQGILVVRGADLNITQLNLDKGSITIDGSIKALTYDDSSRNKRGIWERLLK